jgi:hypothetical protein
MKDLGPATKTPPGASRRGFSVQLACCTETLVSEIKFRESTRKDIALTYALALVSEEKTDWATVNKAARERWSMSGLEFIKRHAWKLVNEWDRRAKAAPAAPEPSPAEGSRS